MFIYKIVKWYWFKLPLYLLDFYRDFFPIFLAIKIAELIRWKMLRKIAKHSKKPIFCSLWRTRSIWLILKMNNLLQKFKINKQKIIFPQCFYSLELMLTKTNFVMKKACFEQNKSFSIQCTQSFHNFIDLLSKLLFTIKRILAYRAINEFSPNKIIVLMKSHCLFCH